MADIQLTRPAAGSTQTIPSSPDGRYVFNFPADAATLSKNGDNLGPDDLGFESGVVNFAAVETAGLIAGEDGDASLSTVAAAAPAAEPAPAPAPGPDPFVEPSDKFRIYDTNSTNAGHSGGTVYRAGLSVPTTEFPADLRANDSTRSDLPSSLVIRSSEGVRDITINGVAVVRNGALVGGGVTLDTPDGVLKITGFGAWDDGKATAGEGWRLDYNYVLTQSSGNDAAHSFAVLVTDNLGQRLGGAITVNVEGVHGDDGNDLMVYDIVDTIFDGGAGIDFVLSDDPDMTMDKLCNGWQGGPLDGPHASNVEVLIKGADALSLTSLAQLKADYGITLNAGNNASKMTLDMDKWTQQADGSYAFKGGADLTLEVNGMTQDTTASGEHQAVFLLQSGG